MKNDNKDNEQQSVAEPDITYQASPCEHMRPSVSPSQIPEGCVSFEEFSRIFEQKMADRYANL